jgi:hypothetical protein
MASLTIEVPPELEKQLKEGAQKQGVPLSDYVRPALEALLASDVPRKDGAPQQPKDGVTEASTGESILAMMQEIWTQVPPEEWAALPPDLSENLDHYLYGVPKKS